MSVSADRKVALNALAVNNFQDYLRIPSVHPNINYAQCIAFLKRQADSLGLPCNVYEILPGKPIVVITWTGTDRTMPTIMLNSHMDVVPVFEENWTYKPFNAEIHDGKIYGRGTQDMKCVGIQYLEAIRYLKEDGVKLKRTIHVTFVPDEEIGGIDGMKKFVESNDFSKLNIGFSLDEGMASPTEEYSLYYGERCIWQFHIHVPGQTGHGSLLLDNTPGEKVTRLLDKIYDFRRVELQRLRNNTRITIGDVTTLNLTQIHGGVQSNVVPSEIILTIDCRIPVTTDLKEWEDKIVQWCVEAGSGIWIEYEQKQPQVPVTKLDNSNSYWTTFKQACDSLNLSLKPQIFPGGTDSRYIRSLGLPAIGFSPMNNTPILLHDNDEYIRVDTFLKGIEIYRKIITELGNTEDRTG